MDYNKDKITKDKAKTWKIFNKLTVYTIIFVAIHELAHIMTPETGHTPLFWDNMKFLLEQASSQGIYMPINYSESPVKYCGMDINSTPMDV